LVALLVLNLGFLFYTIKEYIYQYAMIENNDELAVTYRLILCILFLSLTTPIIEINQGYITEEYSNIEVLGKDSSSRYRFTKRINKN